MNGPSLCPIHGGAGTYKDGDTACIVCGRILRGPREGEIIDAYRDDPHGGVMREDVKTLIEWLENPEPILSVDGINALYSVLENLKIAEAEVAHLDDANKTLERVAMRADATAEGLRAEAARLREALEIRRQPIVMGRGRVVVCTAHTADDEVDREILLIDVGAKRCIGEPCLDLLPPGEVIRDDDTRLLARIVIDHPDGAEVLIDKIEEAAEKARKALEG